MSFHDLLNAIVAQTDADIARLKEAHASRVTALKQETKGWIDARERDIDQRAADRRKEIIAKAETHALQERRRKVTQCKRDLLDDIYGKAVEALASLPAAKTETILASLLDGIDGDGIIRPTSAHRAILKKIVGKRFELGEDVPGAGGFLFQGEHEERDCTYENLVENSLRPKTEMGVLRSLFPSKE